MIPADVEVLPVLPALPIVAAPYSLAILLGLTRTGRHVYAGTVPPAEVRRRRVAGKAARAARRVTRATAH